MIRCRITFTQYAINTIHTTSSILFFVARYGTAMMPVPMLLPTIMLMASKVVRWASDWMGWDMGRTSLVKILIFYSYKSLAVSASCNTLEQLIPRLSASLDIHAGSETFLRTALVSVMLRYFIVSA